MELKVFGNDRMKLISGEKPSVKGPDLAQYDKHNKKAFGEVRSNPFLPLDGEISGVIMVMVS